MDKIKLKARAKVNLSLDVVGKMPNGYHELSMIMQTIDLSDLITIKKNHNSIINLDCTGYALPCDKDNLAYRAAKAYMDEYNIDQGVDIHIEKRIPIGSGLAGGSCDAAAVLLGLNQLMNFHACTERLMEIGLQLGADVPFAMVGGTALAEGIGERLTKVQYVPMDLLIIKPEASMSTRYVYQNLDLQNLGERPDNSRLIQFLDKGDIVGISSQMRNVLESVTVKELKEIPDIKRSLMEHGALGAMMTGSGSAVFGIFENSNKTNRAYKEFAKAYKNVYKTVTTKEGVEIL